MLVIISILLVVIIGLLFLIWSNLAMLSEKAGLENYYPDCTDSADSPGVWGVKE